MKCGCGKWALLGPCCPAPHAWGAKLTTLQVWTVVPGTQPGSSVVTVYFEVVWVVWSQLLQSLTPGHDFCGVHGGMPQSTLLQHSQKKPKMPMVATAINKGTHSECARLIKKVFAHLDQVPADVALAHIHIFCRGQFALLRDRMSPRLCCSVCANCEPAVLTISIACLLQVIQGHGIAVTPVVSPNPISPPGPHGTWQPSPNTAPAPTRQPLAM